MHPGVGPDIVLLHLVREELTEFQQQRVANYAAMMPILRFDVQTIGDRRPSCRGDVPASRSQLTAGAG